VQSTLWSPLLQQVALDGGLATVIVCARCGTNSLVLLVAKPRLAHMDRSCAAWLQGCVKVDEPIVMAGHPFGCAPSRCTRGRQREISKHRSDNLCGTHLECLCTQCLCTVKGAAPMAAATRISAKHSLLTDAVANHKMQC